jgi:hypothetical protein
MLNWWELSLCTWQMITEMASGAGIEGFVGIFKVRQGGGKGDLCYFA